MTVSLRALRDCPQAAAAALRASAHGGSVSVGT